VFVAPFTTLIGHLLTLGTYPDHYELLSDDARDDCKRLRVRASHALLDVVPVVGTRTVLALLTVELQRGKWLDLFTSFFVYFARRMLLVTLF
jgi:hypothetical protein